MSGETEPNSNATTRALMFGCGNMGQALISGWKKAQGVAFTVIDPAKPEIGPDVDVHASLDTVTGEFDLVIIAVKPQMIADVMSKASDKIGATSLILSIAAGTNMQSLQTLLGNRPVVRMMPNMPASVKLGLLGLYANDNCSSDDKALIEKLSSENGTFIWLDDEDKIDRFTAIAGSGPGYVFEIMRLFAKSAESLGFSEDEARMLSVGTFYGAAGMADENKAPLEDLREAVTSKKGVTLAGLEQLMADDILGGLLNSTVDAAYKRAVELR